MKREEIKANFGDNYDGFLRGLEMRMEIFHPVEDSEVTRCIELLQRSNQLNISTHPSIRQRSSPIFQAYWQKNMQCYAFRCQDKFGDYGIVGFISIALQSIPQLNKMAISCRVSQKHFEHALVYCVTPKGLKRTGIMKCSPSCIRQSENGPLVEVFRGLPFEVIEENEQSIIYKLPDLGMVKDEKIISITSRDQEST